MTSLAKACFVSLGLLLISSAAQAQVCQSEMVSAESLGLEYFVSETKTNSLLEAPLSEYCPPQSTLTLYLKPTTTLTKRLQIVIIVKILTMVK